MKIKSVSVKNLFKIFNHDIPLSSVDRVTIIHSPNGFGKTALLKLINAVFNGRYYEIQQIPFKELIITFDDKESLFLRRELQKAAESESPRRLPAQLVFELSRGKGLERESYKVPRLKREDFRFPINAIEEYIPGLARIGAEAWSYQPTQEVLNLEDVIDRFSTVLPALHQRAGKESEPPWLKSIKESIHVRFIETQRLLALSYARSPREYNVASPMIPAVARYSEELAKAIQAKLAEYGTLSQSLDRTFPNRLVRPSNRPELTVEELRVRLDQLEQKRARLMAAGLLDKEGEVDFTDFQTIDDSNRNVLSVYVDDVQKKLSVLDDLTNKIDLLMKIINSKFLYKQLSISKNEGFVFRITGNGDRPLPPASLSSGEQHELVLWYELLFKLVPNSLVLIDEPELSLHVFWQQQFLKDLLEVTQLAEFNVLIATHAPQIIHDRWDLAVELKGPAT